MAEDKDHSEDSARQQSQGEMKESEIDANLMDTFPASDPPSWTLGSNHRSDSIPEQGSGDIEED